MGNTRQHIPILIDSDALFELFRDRIAAEVARQIKERIAELSKHRNDGWPEIMPPRTAAKFLGISTDTLTRRYGKLRIFHGGKPMYRKGDLMVTAEWLKAPTLRRNCQPCDVMRIYFKFFFVTTCILGNNIITFA